MASGTIREGDRVYADPAGHPFCLGWGLPNKEQLARYLATHGDRLIESDGRNVAEWPGDWPKMLKITLPTAMLGLWGRLH